MNLYLLPVAFLRARASEQSETVRQLILLEQQKYQILSCHVGRERKTVLKFFKVLSNFEVNETSEELAAAKKEAQALKQLHCQWKINPWSKNKFPK